MFQGEFLCGLAALRETDLNEKSRLNRMALAKMQRRKELNSFYGG
jgi:hypothetical protein